MHINEMSMEELRRWLAEQRPDYQRLAEQQIEHEERLARSFGVELYDPFARLILRKGKSRFLTKEEIAQTVVDASYAFSLEGALKNIDTLLKNGIGDAVFREYTLENGEQKYRLEYAGPLF